MRRQNGFTLVEMIGAIAIMAVLAALVTVAAGTAIRHMRNISSAAELGEIAKALEIYKQKYGEYPPDGTDEKAVKRHIKKRWPGMMKENDLDKIEEKACGICAIPYRSLTYWLCDAEEENGNAPLIEKKEAFGSPSEIGIPVSGANYNIALRCLCDVNGIPYAYFRAVKTDQEKAFWTEDTDDQDRPKGAYRASGDSAVCAAKGYAVPGHEDCGFAVPYVKTIKKVDDQGNCVYQWYNEESYQLIAAGKDMTFGGDDETLEEAESAAVRAVSPPTADPYLNMTAGDADNLANFSQGQTLDGFMTGEGK